MYKPDRNNVYRLRLRELREEFAKDAKRDARRAKLIDNAERAEAKAELNLLHSATVRHKWY